MRSRSSAWKRSILTMQGEKQEDLYRRRTWKASLSLSHKHTHTHTHTDTHTHTYTNKNKETKKSRKGTWISLEINDYNDTEKFKMRSKKRLLGCLKK